MEVLAGVQATSQTKSLEKIANKDLRLEPLPAGLNRCSSSSDGEMLGPKPDFAAALFINLPMQAIAPTHENLFSLEVGLNPVSKRSYKRLSKELFIEFCKKTLEEIHPKDNIICGLTLDEITARYNNNCSKTLNGAFQIDKQRCGQFLHDTFKTKWSKKRSNQDRRLNVVWKRSEIIDLQQIAINTLTKGIL